MSHKLGADSVQKFKLLLVSMTFCPLTNPGKQRSVASAWTE